MTSPHCLDGLPLACRHVLAAAAGLALLGRRGRAQGPQAINSSVVNNILGTPVHVAAENGSVPVDVP